MNVARYYHHETVRIRGRDDDVKNNIRAGMDIRDAVNHRAENSITSSRTSVRVGRTTSIASRKRSSSYADTPLPPSKRSCSTSPVKRQTITAPNRVHRRIVLRDFGKPIYKASSRASLLSAMKACIEGHESLRSKAGILQRDISTNNLMINEDEENPSWRAFLIDLDLAIKERREGTSGAKGKTGTRVFMAIGVLLGEQHSFMHDLESFFWVLFWLCIHYDGPNQGRVLPEFDQWNFLSMESLAELKKGRVSDEGDFIKAAKENFTPYYQPLVPWVNRLRKSVFPNGGRWKKEDERLYTRFKEILLEAQDDPAVLANI
jgi:serine/threonine protein kinase